MWIRKKEKEFCFNIVRLSSLSNSTIVYIFSFITTSTTTYNTDLDPPLKENTIRTKFVKISMRKK